MERRPIAALLSGNMPTREEVDNTKLLLDKTTLLAEEMKRSSESFNTFVTEMKEFRKDIPDLYAGLDTLGKIIENSIGGKPTEVVKKDFSKKDLLEVIKALEPSEKEEEKKEDSKSIFGLIGASLDSFTDKLLDSFLDDKKKEEGENLLLTKLSEQVNYLNEIREHFLESNLDDERKKLIKSMLDTLPGNSEDNPIYAKIIDNMGVDGFFGRGSPGVPGSPNDRDKDKKQSNKPNANKPVPVPTNTPDIPERNNPEKSKPAGSGRIGLFGKLLGLAGVAYSAGEGAVNAEEYLNKENVSTGERIASGTAGILNAATLGLINQEETAKILAGTDEGKQLAEKNRKTVEGIGIGDVGEFAGMDPIQEAITPRSNISSEEAWNNTGEFAGMNTAVESFTGTGTILKDSMTNLEKEIINLKTAIETQKNTLPMNVNNVTNNVGGNQELILPRAKPQDSHPAVLDYIKNYAAIR